jgi:hypothetical protein
MKQVFGPPIRATPAIRLARSRRNQRTGVLRALHRSPRPSCRSYLSIRCLDGRMYGVSSLAHDAPPQLRSSIAFGISRMWLRQHRTSCPTSDQARSQLHSCRASSTTCRAGFVDIFWVSLPTFLDDRVGGAQSFQHPSSLCASRLAISSENSAGRTAHAQIALHTLRETCRSITALPGSVTAPGSRSSDPDDYLGRRRWPFIGSWFVSSQTTLGRERPLSCRDFIHSNLSNWPKPVHRNFRSMPIQRMLRGRHEMLRGKLSTTNLRAHPTNSPTINQSSLHRRTGQEPDGRRGGLPRHVRWTSCSHARHYVAEEGHHTYRKMLNLRPMRDGGIMSASKFTSRIHHCSGGSR